MPCAAHAIAVGDRLDELGPETDAVLVTFTDDTNLTRYVARTSLPYRVVRDPDRRGYRAYGLGRGSVARVWGLRALRRYLQLVRPGGRLKPSRPTEDPLQLGGDFVIGPDGVLEYGYWGAGPDDRPGIEELMDAARPAP